MTTTTINGFEMYYVERGTGVPCVALHGGLGFDHTYFASAFGPLEDVLHFIYPDQRGNGRSERVPVETITIPQLADDVEALREHLALEKVALLGHSYGGFVALEYATRHPDRLSHLIALDTSPGGFEPTQDELEERADPSWITPDVQRAAQRFQQGLPETNEEFAEMLPVIAPIYLKDFPPSELAAILGATILDAAAASRSMQVLQGWSVADNLGRISCPTLVVCGRYDLLTTPECSKRLSTAIPDAEVVFFEKSGHFPWLEEPEPFFAAIRDWLARHP
jgi:proline iminopeptidase